MYLESRAEHVLRCYSLLEFRFEVLGELHGFLEMLLLRLRGLKGWWMGFGVFRCGLDLWEDVRSRMVGW